MFNQRVVRLPRVHAAHAGGEFKSVAGFLRPLGLLTPVVCISFVPSPAERRTSGIPTLPARPLPCPKDAPVFFEFRAHRCVSLLKPNDSRLNCLTKSSRLFFGLAHQFRSVRRLPVGNAINFRTLWTAPATSQAPVTKTTQERQHTRSMPTSTHGVNEGLQIIGAPCIANVVWL